jgi:DNA (cytosine-5)-methyltransferase 1
MKIVEGLLPKVILLENVAGIGFEGKDEGLTLLRHKLEEINRRKRTKYDPVVFTINSADYGVPQIRNRVFLVAARDGKKFIPPSATHGEGRTDYITAWDAIGDLSTSRDETLQPRGMWTELLESIPEGQNYQWHTDRGGGEPLFGFRRRYWSFLLKLAKQKPSWTIQAQPGPSIGPFHWGNRLLSPRELARLQTFPDDYSILGTRRSIQRQIGNAVPPLLGEIIGRELLTQLLGGKPSRRLLRFRILPRIGCPPPERVKKIPSRYRSLIGTHAPHPGEGKGPGVSRR